MSNSEGAPILFCFSGPSASGKSTICRKLLEADEDSLMLSVSTTTREPREGEQEGKDYYFVSKEEFQKRVSEGKFIEHAQYGSNLYGTENANIENAKNKELDLLLDIDVQGVEQLKILFESQIVVVFVIPPSLEELEARFRARPGSTEEKLKQRMEIAKEELEILGSEGFSDYLLLNDKLDLAIEDAKAIVRAEKLRVR